MKREIELCGDVTLERLGFTKKYKVRFIFINEMFQIKMVSFPSLNVPSKKFQQNSISAG